jgi:MFS family permease
VATVGEVIGDLLPLALGVAISPVPVIAVILMLLAPRAGAASRGFLAGWVTGIVAGLVVFALLAAFAGMDSGGPQSWAAVLRLLLGLLLLLLAARQWRSRPRPGEPVDLPGWLRAIDRVTTLAAVGLGLLLSAVNPKNLVLLAGAGADLGGAGLPAWSAIVVGVVFVVLAASTVLLPVTAYAVAADRIRARLDSLRGWLTDNNSTIMTVLLVVMGGVLIGKGIGGL